MSILSVCGRVLNSDRINYRYFGQGTAPISTEEKSKADWLFLMKEYSAEVYDSQVPQISVCEIFSCGET
jgi:hypothetical protein